MKLNRRSFLNRTAAALSTLPLMGWLKPAASSGWPSGRDTTGEYDKMPPLILKYRGLNSSQFDNPANWSGGSPPSPSDTVVFDTGE